jgi:hypothetical protein
MHGCRLLTEGKRFHDANHIDLSMTLTLSMRSALIFNRKWLRWSIYWFELSTPMFYHRMNFIRIYWRLFLYQDEKDIYEYVYPNERQITMASSLVKFWSQTRSHSPLLNTSITPSLGLDPPYRRTGISEIKIIKLDLQLLMQSVHITIDVVSSNLLEHYLIKFVSGLRQVGGFLKI